MLVEFLLNNRLVIYTMRDNETTGGSSDGVVSARALGSRRLVFSRSFMGVRLVAYRRSLFVGPDGDGVVLR